MMHRFLAARVLPLAAALWLATPTARALAQSASAAEIRAGFAVNFVKFTEWPADTLTPGAPLTICVFDDPLGADALEHIAHGHAVSGHEIRVARLSEGDSPHACQVVDATRLGPKAKTQLLAELKASAVLTVAQSPDFIKQGGITELYVEGNRMRFAVNLSAAQRARLQLSAKLLSLARVIEDE